MKLGLLELFLEALQAERPVLRKLLTAIFEAGPSRRMVLVNASCH